MIVKIYAKVITPKFLVLIIFLTILDVQPVDVPNLVKKWRAFGFTSFDEYPRSKTNSFLNLKLF